LDILNVRDRAKREHLTQFCFVYTPFLKSSFKNIEENIEENIENIGVGANVQVAKYDLAIYVTENTKGFEIVIRYRLDLFDRATIEKILHMYRELILQIQNNPYLDLHQIESVLKS